MLVISKIEPRRGQGKGLSPKSVRENALLGQCRQAVSLNSFLLLSCLVFALLFFFFPSFLSHWLPNCQIGPDGWLSIIAPYSPVRPWKTVLKPPQLFSPSSPYLLLHFPDIPELALAHTLIQVYTLIPLNNLHLVFFYSLCLYVCTFVMLCMWGAEDNLQELALSFHKCLYPLNHIVDP